MKNYFYLFLISICCLIRSLIMYGEDLHEKVNSIKTKPSKIYFVSISGNDDNLGLSEYESWKTLEKISNTVFQPGDIVKFNGGDTFVGNLVFNDDEGTASEKINLTSYGTGMAIINPPSGSGITVANNGGFIIENLNLIGDYNPDTENGVGSESNGINIYNFYEKKCNSIEIKNVTIRNFKSAGINIGGQNNSLYGYTNVWVNNSLIFNCGNSGINIWNLKYQDLKIFGNTIHDINGYMPHLNGFSGNGITLSHVYNTTIERNLIYNNGKYAKHSGGGIATGESRNIFVRYNEIYGIKSNDVDGDAIDFDNGSDSCIAEYNYTHNNDGAGFLISGLDGGSGSDNNIIRYNISKNDGLKNNYSSILLYSQDALNNQIYNNTIISTSKGRNTPRCVGIYSENSGTTFINNIFYAENSALLLEVDNSKHTNLRFQANDYYAGNGNFIINWGNTQFYSFQAYSRKTEQEVSDSQNFGLNVNPLLVNPLTLRDTVNNPFMIDTLSAYKLLPQSILIDKGVNPDSFSRLPTKDFYGNRLMFNSKWDIGAFEFE